MFLENWPMAQPTGRSNSWRTIRRRTRFIRAVNRARFNRVRVAKAYPCGCCRGAAYCPPLTLLYLRLILPTGTGSRHFRFGHIAQLLGKMQMVAIWIDSDEPTFAPKSIGNFSIHRDAFGFQPSII